MTGAFGPLCVSLYVTEKASTSRNHLFQTSGSAIPTLASSVAKRDTDGDDAPDCRGLKPACAPE